MTTNIKSEDLEIPLSSNHPPLNSVVNLKYEVVSSIYCILIMTLGSLKWYSKTVHQRVNRCLSNVTAMELQET